MDVRLPQAAVRVKPRLILYVTSLLTHPSRPTEDRFFELKRQQIGLEDVTLRLLDDNANTSRLAGQAFPKMLEVGRGRWPHNFQRETRQGKGLSLLLLPERLLDFVEGVCTTHPHVCQVPLAKALKLIPRYDAVPPLTE
jgi:hypothetical protein